MKGNPVVAYYDVTNGELTWVRANDANGIAWGIPVVVTSSDMWINIARSL